MIILILNVIIIIITITIHNLHPLKLIFLYYNYVLANRIYFNLSLVMFIKINKFLYLIMIFLYTLITTFKSDFIFLKK